MSDRTASVQIVSITAYLLGVKEEMFSREFKTSVFQELEESIDARTVRVLSQVRNVLLLQNGAIDRRLRSGISLQSLTDFFEPDLIPVLETLSPASHDDVRGYSRVNEYLLTVNARIEESLPGCGSLFPTWVEFDYIKNLFTMGDTPMDLKTAVDNIHLFKNSYPYRCYINWPIRDPRAYSDDPATNAFQTSGNVLQNDRRFLKLLYYVNGAEFKDFDRVVDIGRGVRNDLRRFMAEAEKIVLAVDCENSDPYKLCAVLSGLKEVALRQGDSFSKLQKIILFDDENTISTWEILSEFVSVPIEHVQTHRVNDHKSLVDIQLTAGVTREHYANGVDSFLLASSDSDYWGLINSLPDAHFMVLLEQDKSGQRLMETLNENGVGFCAIEDFAENTDNIRIAAMRKGVTDYLDEMMQLDLRALVDWLDSELRTGLTERQKENFLQQLRLQLVIEEDALRVELED